MRVINGNGKLKGSAMRDDRAYPYASPVRFHNRPADGQAHAHPRRLRRVKRLEKALDVLGSDARSRIEHSDKRTTRVVLARADCYLPRPLIDCARRFNGVDDQVQHHLLELDTIAFNERQVVGKLHPHRHAVLLGLTARQRDDLTNRLIDLQPLLAWWNILDEATNSRRDLAAPHRAFNNSVELLAGFLQIRRFSVQPA